MVSFDPTRTDFLGYGFSCGRWAPSVMRRPDRHNEIELNFLTSGHLTYLFGGQIIRVEACELAAFWAAIPHQIIDHGPQPEYFVVTIPLGWFLRCKLRPGAVQALLHGQVICSRCADRVHQDEQHLRNWEDDFRSNDATALRATYLEIEARLRRLFLASHGESAPAKNQSKRRICIQEGGFAKAEQIARLVAQRYTDDLTVETIVQELRLNRKLAMSLFHNVFGTSFAGYVTQHRISHAQRLLVTSAMSVVDIAASAGFGSLSHFNRAFRKACDCSPREYRQTHSILVS